MSLFRAKETQDAVFHCPRDGAAMAKLVAEHVTIDRCERCGGSWFDRRELRRVAHDAEVEALATRLRQVRVQSGFPCPRCGGECVQSFVGEVEVDTCVACHGVWLDRNELEEAKRQVHVNRVLSEAPSGFRAALGRL